MRFLGFVASLACAFFLVKAAFLGAVDFYDKKTKNPEAVAAGFQDYREMDQARAAGFAEPEAFRAAMVWADQVRKETEAKKEEERAAARAALEEANRNPAERMDVDTVSWTKSGFGTVGIATLLVTNSNSYPVKDIGLTCRFVAKSGTEVSTARHTIYETMKANSKKTFRNVNVGFIHSQAERGSCRLTTASRL